MQRTSLCTLACLATLACGPSAAELAEAERAAAEADGSKKQANEPAPAPARGQLERRAPVAHTLTLAGDEWEFSSGDGATRTAKRLEGSKAADPLDFRPHLATLRALGITFPLEGSVALQSGPTENTEAFIRALETLAHAGVRQLVWRVDEFDAGLEVRAELPRYEWRSEAQSAAKDPTELMLVVRGNEVVAGLRPLAYFAQDRIAEDIAPISNRDRKFRTPARRAAEKLPLADWMTRLCADAKDERVHVGLSIDATSELEALWTLAGQLPAPEGCELVLRFDSSLPPKPEGPAPNIHAFEDARRIVDLTRPASPLVRLQSDRLRNAALTDADRQAITAREPELMMTVTDEKGREHSGIQRAVWSAGEAINDCYRVQREQTPLWAPRALASGMLRARARKSYVAVEGLDAAPEFAACVKHVLEQPYVTEMDRLLGFRATLSFNPFGGVVHDKDTG